MQHREIAVRRRRRRRRSPLLLLGLHRTTIPVARLLLMLFLLSQHCSPRHHHHNAAQAFMLGLPPQSPAFLARHRYPSFSVHSSFSSPSPSNGGSRGDSGFRAFRMTDRDDDNEPQRTGTYKKEGEHTSLVPPMVPSNKGKKGLPAAQDTKWEARLQLLKEFQKEQGHCQVPQKYSVDDVNLGNWVATQRLHYRKYLAGKYSPMTQERIDQLNSVGFDWEIFMTGWKGTFEKLVQFKELHGHCRVPRNYSVADVNLGNWVATQRLHYRKYLAGKYSPITQEQIDALESLGFNWGTANTGWKGTFEKLVQFKELYGHCQVPQKYSVDGISLGTWVTTQRSNYRKYLAGKGSPMTQERIDQLNSIGFDWGTAKTGWEVHFQKLVQFKELHGHCQVPSNYSADDVNLGNWVSFQRQEYLRLREGQHSTMTQERINALEKVDFYWGKHKIEWEAYFQMLQEFQEVHGHCQVPQNYSVNDHKLGSWVRSQRAQYKKFQDGKDTPMTQERIDALEKIGFVWKLQKGWEAQFQLLQEFQKEHGHCQVPRNHSVNNIKLGRWVSNQRVQYKNLKDGRSSSMTHERIDQLNSIGFDWSKPQIGWEAQFRLLSEFQKENGHCRVPLSHSVDNVRLGIWVQKQRSEYKKFQDGKPSSMTQERINQLNAIGFQWKVYNT